MSELARPFPVSLPAIMKHLDVLADAGLIERHKTGRTVACELRAEPMQEAMDWLNTLSALLGGTIGSSRRFCRGEIMQAEAKLAQKPSLTIKRHFNAPPSKLYAAWTDPKQIAKWMGPEGIDALHSEADPRVGGRYRFVMKEPTARSTMSAASIAKSSPTRNLSSPGPGAQRRSASRSSP